MQHRKRKAAVAYRSPPIRSLRPLVEFVDFVDVPIFDLLQLDVAESAIGQILVADVWSDLDNAGFTLGADFYLGKLPRLQLPGLDQVAITFNEDGMARGELHCAEESFLQLDALELALEFAPEILSDEKTGAGAAIETECGVRVDRDGIHFLTFRKASLPRSRIAGTPVVISLKNITLSTDPERYLAVESGEIELPMFSGAGRKPLVLEGENLSFGRHGPSGRFARNAGPPLELEVFGFQCEIDEASVTLANGRIRKVDLSGRIDLSKFSPSGQRWMAVEFSLGSAGLTATLSDDEPVIELHTEGLLKLGVNSIRLVAPVGSDPGTLWLSGTLTPEIDGVEGEWPTFKFDEIGITADGKLRLAQGAQIATDRPFTLSWQFASLCVTAFSLERPKDAPDDLVLRISASVELLKGVPAGASVDGLEARWQNGNVTLCFDGIGLTFGEPGAYTASVNVAWDGWVFKGSGSLEVPSIDLAFAALFEAGTATTAKGDTFNTLFLTAETELPAGVPIGSTGLSLYAVSGILAHNRAIRTTDPTDPRRFYNAYMDGPRQGLASISKWDPVRGAHALGLGVVIGTGDDGWTFSTRGSLILSFPELSVLLTASADLVTQREPLDNAPEGKLTAVLAILPAIRLMRLDYGFEWTKNDLFQVQGEGGGEFYFDRPLAWKVWAGHPPERGSPITAKVLRFDSKWLLSGGYWMEIDARRSISMGALAGIELRTGSGRLYAEVVGSARGDFTFTWAPYQLDGTITLNARGRIAAGGLSLACRLTSGASCWLPRPKRLRIPLEACIDIDVGYDTYHICLRYTFTWEDSSIPAVPSLYHGLSAMPRDWVPRPSTVADKSVDSGIVASPLANSSGDVELETVWPHSTLALEFGKSMNIAFQDPLVDLNDVAKPYPDPISAQANWLVRWDLARLALHDETEAKDVKVFGTFQRSAAERETASGTRISPRPFNTQLWLLSSNRFGPDGSMGGGGVEDTPKPDCAPKPTTVRKCISLVGLEAEYGWLSNGWAYYWRAVGTNRPDSSQGIELGVEDVFEVAVPQNIDPVFFTYLDRTSNPPLPAQEQRVPNTPPGPIQLRDRGRLYTSLCWDELITSDGTGHREDWDGSSGEEEWSVPPEMRLLHPGHQYTLEVSGSAVLLNGNSSRTVSPFVRRYHFQAGRAPDWKGALDKAVEAVYPNGGCRPVYRSYDLVVRFRDDYVRALYQLDRRRLALRLIDGNGVPLDFGFGRTISPELPWTSGQVTMSPAERWWRETRAPDACEVQRPPPQERDTVLPVPISTLDLRPLERYTVELVGVEDEMQQKTTVPLARWSFTTSAFATFSELAAAPASVPALGLIQTMPAAEQTFDALARSFEIPLVAVVRSTSITPVRCDDQLAYLLIEAPEPLDDHKARLVVTVDGRPTTLHANLDRTRLIAALDTPIVLQGNQQVGNVMLNWAAVPANSYPEEHRTIAGNVPVESCTWVLPLRGLFP